MRNSPRPTRFKLVALDLDGTLLDSRGRLRPRTLATLHALHHQGTALAVATGRRWASARPFLEGFPPAALITNQGAVLRLGVDEPVFCRWELPLQSARGAAAFCRDANLSAIVHGAGAEEGRMIVGPLPPEPHWLHRLVERYPDDVTVAEDLPSTIQKEPACLSVVLEDSQLDPALGADLARAAGGLARVARCLYASGMLALDVLQAQCSKGTAVAFLARKLGILRREILAIGDNLNDLDMLAYAGLGLAMGNAQPPLKARFATLPSNDEEGAAQALEQYVLR